MESSSMMSPWQGGTGQHLMPFQSSMLSQDMQKFSPILSMDFVETETDFHVQAGRRDILNNLNLNSINIVQTCLELIQNLLIFQLTMIV